MELTTSHEPETTAPAKREAIHLIAVGGSIMHNLALALHRRGARVTGSDDEIVEPAAGRLRGKPARTRYLQS